MIKIAGEVTGLEGILEGYPLNSLNRDIAQALSSSSTVYKYDSLEQLKFEINLRSNTADAAKELYRSRFSFDVFRKSKCNADYWNRTDEGGFECREDVKPSDAVRDIFAHGSKYATECATAIVIVFYKAILDIFLEDRFDKQFTGIYLMNWQHVDGKMGIDVYQKVPDALPGDCRYFKNPDVDPLTPEWQGENVIDLGNGLYYGHGIGIKTDEGIIRSLNKHRKENAEVPAFLMEQVTLPGFEKLESKYL